MPQIGKSAPAETSVAQLPSPNWDNSFLVGCKRTLDVGISALLLALLSPLFLVLAATVKLTSRGTVFYRWQVVGQRGLPFTGFKFRSMYSNADELKAQLERLNEMSGPVFKLTNDPRVTKVGAWMRRYSLDELPQLYSVLKGDMSLVGPRPLLMEYLAHYSPQQARRHEMRPGVTGWAQ